MKILKTPLFSKTQLIILCILATTTFITKFIVIFHPSIILPRDDGLYYLFFSENLRLVYPDHTPMVAYFLAFARFVFNLLVPGTFEDYLPGSLALVPISSTIYFLFLYAFIYFFVAHVWKNKPLAILLVFTFLLTPYLWGISFLTTPETPLTFFAFPAVLLFAHAFLKQPENLKVWLLAGFFLAGAFLGKILAIPLGISIALYAIISPKRKLYLTNYRFYLAFTPAIIAGLVVLYADYLDNFSMIRFLLLRGNEGTDLNVMSRFFFNQFVYYTPLLFSLVLFLPIINIYIYTRKTILPPFFKKKKLASVTTNTHQAKKEEQKKENFWEELLFYLALLSLFCMGFLYYQIFNIGLLNWWGGFTAAPNLLFICVWLEKKLLSTAKTLWQKITFANFFLVGSFCIFASFHSIYGVLDEKYSTYVQLKQTQPTTLLPFKNYNLVLNNLAGLLKNVFGHYPEENSDWLYIYETIPNEFKKYHDKKMNKSLPIITSSYGPAVKTHYLVHRNHPPMGLTRNNSTFTTDVVNDFSIFDSSFHMNDFKNKNFYILSYRHIKIASLRYDDIKEYSSAPSYCTLEKEFTSKRYMKSIAIYTLLYCTGNPKR